MTSKRMRLEPALYAQRLMGGRIVDDQAEDGGPMIDRLEKARELSLPVVGRVLQFRMRVIYYTICFVFSA